MLHPGVFLGAGLLDEAVGDPEGWPHPVRAFGGLIAGADRARRGVRSPLALRMLGLLPKTTPERLAARTVRAVERGRPHVRHPHRLFFNFWLNAAPSRIANLAVTGVRFDPLDSKPASPASVDD